MDFACKYLVGLQKFRLKTRTFNRVGISAQQDQMIRTRTLISTTARLVKYHPTLRKVVWRSKSGGELSDGYVEAEKYVDMVEYGFEKRLEAPRRKQDAFGN
jgi:hypothetical protein